MTQKQPDLFGLHKRNLSMAGFEPKPQRVAKLTRQICRIADDMNEMLVKGNDLKHI